LFFDNLKEAEMSIKQRIAVLLVVLAILFVIIVVILNVMNINAVDLIGGGASSAGSGQISLVVNPPAGGVA